MIKIITKKYCFIYSNKIRNEIQNEIRIGNKQTLNQDISLLKKKHKKENRECQGIIRVTFGLKLMWL